MRQPDTHDCKEELRDAQLKVTLARLGVLAALESTKIPLDIVSIIAYLQKNHIKADKVTVFRIMNVLTAKGLVKQIQFNEGKLRYEYGARAEHHHFVCEKCRNVEDVTGCTIEALEKDMTKKKGVLVKRHSLEFFGLCANCQK